MRNLLGRTTSGLSLCVVAAVVFATGLENVGGAQEAAVPADVTNQSAPAANESVNENALDILSRMAWHLLSDMAVQLMSGNTAELLSGNEPELLSGNTAEMFARNLANLFSGNEAELLSGNEAELFSGNDVNVFSHNHLSITISHSGNGSGNVEEDEEEDVRDEEEEHEVVEEALYSTFRTLDLDNNGKMTWDEFVSHGSAKKYRKMRRQFKRLDRDADSLLTANEFRSYRMMAGKVRQRNRPARYTATLPQAR